MNNKQRKTLAAVFSNPAPANIGWRDIESLFNGLGAEIEEAEGSRVAVMLNGRAAVFHRPHPQKEASRPMVRSVRRFLENAGVQA